MNRLRFALAHTCRLLIALALALVLLGDQSPADDTTAARALQLYDEGRYAEARKLLEELDGKGQADGAVLYRLYYCQRVTGGAALATETLRRSVERLEQETEGGAGLEASFYLASGYQNLGRQEQASSVAADVLARVEAGELEAASGVAKFRLGKLYADRGNELEAAHWYRSAVQTFGEEGDGNSAYIVWASRYLAGQALEMEDYSAAEIHLTDLVEHGKPTIEDLDRLAVARVRNGMYREAANAWRQSIPLNPAQSNRARYCTQLADAAYRLKGLVESAPSGKSWSEMSRGELEELLKAQARVARETRAEYAQTEELSEERRTEMQQALRKAQRLFVTAGLEFALQGHDIREAAFLGGYAPLVFHDREWKLPTDG